MKSGILVKSEILVMRDSIYLLAGRMQYLKLVEAEFGQFELGIGISGVVALEESHLYRSGRIALIPFW